MSKNLLVNEKKQFLSYKKKLKNINVNIEETLSLFKENPHDTRLHYKKIICKKDKYRYSIRVLGTKYRILMSSYEDKADLHCICNHDDYDRLNKNC